MFEEMFISNKTVDPINTYFVVPPNVALVGTPPKAIKKRRKTRHSKNLATIKGSQSDTTTSFIFLSITLHSVSKAVICSHTEKISMHNNSDTECCAESGAYEDMFPD